MTHGMVWGEITDWENLLKSYQKARKGKRYSPEVLRFENNLEENITNIHNHLIYKSWRPGQWRQFWVYDPKSRLIQAPPFCDRVVHHALVDVVEPFFERKMIFDSHACRTAQGPHLAAARVQKNLRIVQRKWGRTYALQADISKYFPSISHARLLEILPRTIRDPDALWLFETIIRESGYDGRGIPVGALTSQLLANVYLDQLDHFIKDDLGIKCYVRFMDDFVIVGPSKALLWDVLDCTRKFLNEDLNLELNPKTGIYCASSHMVDFAGYRICATHILPRKRNIKRARHSFRRMSKWYAQERVGLDYVKPRIASFLGYVKHCNAWRTTESALSELVLTRNSSPDSACLASN